MKYRPERQKKHNNTMIQKIFLDELYDKAHKVQLEINAKVQYKDGPFPTPCDKCGNDPAKSHSEELTALRLKAADIHLLIRMYLDHHQNHNHDKKT